MKIAIPTRNNEVDDHFGHCEYYAVYEIDDKDSIVSKELLRTQGGCGCKSNLAKVLNEMDVKIMLAGTVGHGALNMLVSNEIQVIRGCSGPIDDLIESFLHGEISDQDIFCKQHECHT